MHGSGKFRSTFLYHIPFYISDRGILRSLSHYVFLAGAAIFSHIIRDARHPQVRDDLQSLNLAATFFSSLAPSDGPADYAGFMTHMSAALERTARMVVDKQEKRARSPDEKDGEFQPSGAKRHSSRLTSSLQSSSGRRTSAHGSSTASLTRNAYHHRQVAAPPTPNKSSTTRSKITDLSIPEAIEGLPPINSSGYVVPLSPSDNSDFTSTTTLQATTTNTNNYPNGVGLDNSNRTITTNYPAGCIPSWQLAQDYSAQTASPLENIQSPQSQNSSTGTNTMIPESWQVPLTADWQYGDDLWSGLFPTDPAQAPNVPMPILSAESFLGAPSNIEATSHSAHNADPTGLGLIGTQVMGNNFLPNSQHQRQGQSQSQDPTQSAEPVFPNGFLGLSQG